MPDAFASALSLRLAMDDAAVAAVVKPPDLDVRRTSSSGVAASASDELKPLCEKREVLRTPLLALLTLLSSSKAERKAGGTPLPPSRLGERLRDRLRSSS